MVQCEAIAKRTGERCKHRAVTGSKYCAQHKTLLENPIDKSSSKNIVKKATKKSPSKSVVKKSGERSSAKVISGAPKTPTLKSNHEMISNTYFQIVPIELLSLGFLYFDSNELLLLLSSAKDIPDLQRLLTYDPFWKQIWKRDISTVILPPLHGPYDRYIAIINRRDILFLAQHGYDVLLYPLLKSVSDYNDVMLLASENNFKSIVNDMLDVGATNIEDSLVKSAANGHIDIVNLFIAKGSKYYVKGMYSKAMAIAALYGHENVVKILSNKTTNYDNTLSAAAANGSMNIINFILPLVAQKYKDRPETKTTIYNHAMAAAAFAGHKNIVEFMIKLGANNYHYTLVQASKNNHVGTINFLLQEINKKYKNRPDINEQFKKYYDDVMVEAARHNNLDLVKLMMTNGAKKYNETMVAAAGVGNMSIVNLMLKYGANNYEEALHTAQNYHHNDLVALIKSHEEQSRRNFR